MLNSNISTISGKISTSATQSMVRNTSDTTVERNMFRGILSSSNPTMQFAHYNASNVLQDNIQIYFNGTDFYAKGQKGGADAVTKKLRSSTDVDNAYATGYIVCARIQPYHYGESVFSIGGTKIPVAGTYRAYFACNDGSWSYVNATIGGSALLNIPTYNDYTGDTMYATSKDKVCTGGETVSLSGGSYGGTMIALIYRIK